MELELAVSESEDYSEFPAFELVEEKLCQRCKRKATTSAISVSIKKEDKTTQTVSRKVLEETKKIAN